MTGDVVLSSQADAYLQQPYARIIIPESDGSYRGEMVEFPGCLASGDTAAEALSNLEDAAKDWLMAVLAKNQSVPQPFDNGNEFSGRLVLRIPKSLHKKAAWAAERDGTSLNQFIVYSLAEAVGEKLQSASNVYFQLNQQFVYQRFDTSRRIRPIAFTSAATNTIASGLVTNYKSILAP
jgi:antitoxin HicB